MQFKQLKSLRVFIFLLLTVFFTDTVYANGMVVVAQAPDGNSTITEHCPGADHSVVHEDHHHKHESQSQQKPSSNDHCSKCTHCMSCFTALPPSQFNNMQSQVEKITTSLFKPSYLSYVSAQPQRPPIF
jgi:hypothetical protein